MQRHIIDASLIHLIKPHAASSLPGVVSFCHLYCFSFAIAFRTDAIAEGDALVHIGGIGQQRSSLGWGIWIRSAAEKVQEG